MKVSRELYQEMQNQTAPKTKSYYTIPMAFLIGGFICTLGELLLHLYAFLGADQTAAAAFTSITLSSVAAFCLQVWAGMKKLQNMPELERSFPSQDSPTLSAAVRLNPVQRVGFWVLVQKSLRLPGLSLSTEQLPACSMD